MQTKAAIAVTAAVFLAGCAATTPAPRFSAVSPADQDGPEAGTPPPAPALAAEREAQAPGPTAETPQPTVGHQGHSMPSETTTTRGHDPHSPTAPEAPSSANRPYSCPMHPEVKQASPGSCPKCGMPLVQRQDERRQP